MVHWDPDLTPEELEALTFTDDREGKDLLRERSVLAANGQATSTPALTPGRRPMPRKDPPRWDDPDFWTASSCVALGGCFMAVLRIAVAVYYALEGYTEGLLTIIATLLAVVLFVLAKGGDGVSWYGNSLTPGARTAFDTGTEAKREAQTPCEPTTYHNSTAPTNS